MITIGRREYDVSPRIALVAPLACGVFSALGLAMSPSFEVAASDFNVTADVTQIAGGIIAGFLFVDLVRRSVVTWYALPVLAILCWLVSTLAMDLFRYLSSFSTLAWLKIIIGAVLVQYVPPHGFLLMLLFGGSIIFVFPVALGIALVLTLGSRIVAGLPLWRQDTLRDCGANLAGALIWVILGLFAFFAVYLVVAKSPPGLASWMSLALALAVAIAAGLAHLIIVRCVRRETRAARASMRSGLAALICLGIFLYSPFTYGETGARLLYDHVRPALRAMHVLPTPLLAVAGFTVDVPFHDMRTYVKREMPDGSPSQVTVPLPSRYGLVEPDFIRVEIRRIDAPPGELVRVGAVDPSKKLKEAQDGVPDRDVVLVMSTAQYTKLALRLIDYPDVDISLIGFNRSTTPEVAEQALRRFLHDCVHRTN